MYTNQNSPVLYCC